MNFCTKQLVFSLIITASLALGCTASAYAVDGCSSAGFKLAPSMSLETIPLGLTVADFDKDGHLDLATTSGIGEVNIMFGRGGTGRFGPPISFPVGPGPEEMAAGDINGDGHVDLVVAHSFFSGPSGSLSFLINDGSGKFGVSNTLTLPGDPYQPVFGDFNNDGKIDLVVGLYTGTTSGTAVVLLGDGAGGFALAPHSPFFTSSVNVAEIVIGDFNEDGKRDLAVPGISGGVDILLGDGTGAFAPGINFPTNVGQVFSLTVADFNGDGHLDLVSDNKVLLGTGSGSFGSPITIALPGHLTTAISGDVNRDGHLDLVAGGTSGVTIMLGDGGGSFVQGQSYTSGTIVRGSGSSFAALGDFNEDGKVDLVGVQAFGLGILDGDGTGSFHDALSYRTSILGPTYLLAADFNGDGKQDFAAVSRELGTIEGASSIEVALGDGNGGFAKKPLIHFSSGTMLSAIATGDFNKDGKVDLAVTQPLIGRISILINDGGGGFPTDGSSAPSYQTSPYGIRPSAIKAGDFNNDGNPDLIAITSNSNNLVLLLGNGSGSFTVSAASSLQGSSNSIEELAIADFNADGKLDLAVVRSSFSGVQVLQGDGLGHFAGYALPVLPGKPISVVARDLNSDGRPDLAVSNSVTPAGPFQETYVSVLINNGTQGFNSATNYPTDGSGNLGIGDFNGDGRPDLAVSSGATYVGSILVDVAVLTNLGDGSFNAPVNFSAGSISSHLAAGDFNGDGRDDLILTQHGSSSVGVLLNNFTTAGPCLSVDNVTVTEGDAGAVAAIFTVKLSAPSAQTVRVNYFFGPISLFPRGPAQKGTDFDSVPGTLTFLPGETVQTISVPIKGDSIDEFDELFFVRLSTSINAAISDGTGIGTILDNDPLPALSINDTSIVEGNFNAPSATFTVSLSGASEKPVSVQYVLASGTATLSVDFSTLTGLVEFPAGTTSKNIVVPILAENVFESDETFFVNLSGAANATIADGQGQGTITNDDPLPTISISTSRAVTEGSAGASAITSFDVTLSNPSDRTITVQYSTGGGSATSGTDYVAASGTLTFNPLQTSGSFNITVSGDNVDEIDETFFVTLANPTNATITGSSGSVTIFDDDGPNISISDVTVTEGNAGTVDANFVVTLSAASPQDIYLQYSTMLGTATPNVDYVGVQSFLGNLMIPAGATTGTFAIKVIGDYQIEANETFAVIIVNQLTSPPPRGTIVDNQGVGTIVNDDTTSVQLTQSNYSVQEGDGHVSVLVERTGDVAGPSEISYSTSDTSGLTPCGTVSGVASSRCDYATTIGTLRFAAGETSKQIHIPLVDDGISDGTESFTLTLKTPVMVHLGAPATATITITDNETGQPVPNPIDQSAFFIREQYIDFLGREPEPAGLQGWLDVLNNCGVTIAPPCDRIEVSAGFFRSQEFQARGYFVYRFYSTVGRIPLYDEFMPDLAKVSGFLSDQQLEENKVAFVQEFMTRSIYLTKYGGINDPTAYVDAVLATLNLPNHPKRADWIAGLTGGTLTKAQVLRQIAESAEVYQKYYNEAFVIMQYFGYLRRTADISYLQWIQTMNDTNGDYRTMINGFLNSAEYRSRFGN